MSEYLLFKKENVCCPLLPEVSDKYFPPTGVLFNATTIENVYQQP